MVINEVIRDDERNKIKNRKDRIEDWRSYENVRLDRDNVISEVDR